MRVKFWTAVMALLLAGHAVSAEATLHIVKVRATEFSPAELIIQRGDVVRWEWESGAHTITSGTGPDDLRAGELADVVVDADHRTIERTFTTGEVFRYFSRVRPEMKGTITVQGFSNVDKRTWGFLKTMFEGPAKGGR